MCATAILAVNSRVNIDLTNHKKSPTGGSHRVFEVDGECGTAALGGVRQAAPAAKRGIEHPNDFTLTLIPIFSTRFFLISSVGAF